jgi:hypothetical protein
MTTFFEGETAHGGKYEIDRFTTKITFSDGVEYRLSTYGLITNDKSQFHLYDSKVKIDHVAESGLPVGGRVPPPFAGEAGKRG